MPGLIQHSPARIVCEALIAAGHATDPERTVGGQWPVYDSREPDRPDAIIKVSDTAGIDFGHTQVDGERQEKQGIQIMVRSANKRDGYYKAQRIAVFIDQLARTLVDIAEIDSVGTGTVNYILHAITRTTNVLHLGSDTPQGKRQLFTINAVCDVRECC